MEECRIGRRKGWRGSGSRREGGEAEGRTRRRRERDVLKWLM